MRGYLIPANSKKSQLIFNLFTPFDLIMFGCGLSVTLLMLVIFDLDNLLTTVLVLAPACVTGFLVMPVPNYHNMFTVIQNVYTFFTNNQKYVWRGWCFSNGKEDKQKQIYKW